MSTPTQTLQRELHEKVNSSPSTAVVLSFQEIPLDKTEEDQKATFRRLFEDLAKIRSPTDALKTLPFGAATSLLNLAPESQRPNKPPENPTPTEAFASGSASTSAGLPHLGSKNKPKKTKKTKTTKKTKNTKKRKLQTSKIKTGKKSKTSKQSASENLR